jgi:SAM-dependent methyltransferase
MVASPPSDWVVRYASLIRPAGKVLDVACGSGRHARFLAESGFQVEAVDRDAQVLSELAVEPAINVRCLDLEEAAWPYRQASFDAVVVTNYLHRPLFPYLLSVLASGGVLIYETFSLGNESLGRPRNPDFLLRPGELLEHVQPMMEVNAFEELCVLNPKPAVVQRICATRRDG